MAHHFSLQNSWNREFLTISFWDSGFLFRKRTNMGQLHWELISSLNHLNPLIISSYNNYKSTNGLRVLCHLFNANSYRGLMTSQWPFFVPVCPVMPILAISTTPSSSSGRNRLLGGWAEISFNKSRSNNFHLRDISLCCHESGFGHMFSLHFCPWLSFHGLCFVQLRLSELALTILCFKRNLTCRQTNVRSV